MNQTTIRAAPTVASFSILRITGSDNVEVSHMTLDGGFTGKIYNGVIGANGGGHYIHRIRVRDLAETDASMTTGPHGVWFQSAAPGCRVERCQFTNIGVTSTWGSAIRFSNASHNGRVLGNRIDHCGRSGITFGNSTGAVVRNNRVVDHGLSRLMAPAGTHGWPGIELFQNSGSAIVENNYVDHWLSVDRSSGSAIRNNVIGGARDSADRLCGLELVESEDVVFADNHIEGGVIRGISMSNDQQKLRVLATRNEVQYARDWGVQISGGDDSLSSQLYFFGNHFDQTGVRPTGGSFGGQGQGFRMRSNDGSQLMNGQVSHVVLDSNMITNSDQYGIQFYGNNVDQIVLRNNLISHSSGFAVAVGATGDAQMPFPWTDFVNEQNDAIGNGSGSMDDFIPPTVGFTANEEPTVTVNAPSLSITGTPVSFSLTYSDMESAAPTSILWDLGAGRPSTVASPTLIYGRPGDYEVSVVVWDDGGRAAHATTTVKIIGKAILR